MSNTQKLKSIDGGKKHQQEGPQAEAPAINAPLSDSFIEWANERLSNAPADAAIGFACIIHNAETQDGERCLMIDEVDIVALKMEGENESGLILPPGIMD